MEPDPFFFLPADGVLVLGAREQDPENAEVELALQFLDLVQHLEACDAVELVV